MVVRQTVGIKNEVFEFDDDQAVSQLCGIARRGVEVFPGIATTSTVEVEAVPEPPVDTSTTEVTPETDFSIDG